MLSSVFSLYANRPEFFLRMTLEHLKLSGAAIGIALVIGLAIGIFIARHEKVAHVVISLINVLYTIPSISMFGFLLPLTGIGDTSAIIALSLYALMPMVRNTYTGIQSIDPAMLRVANAMGTTPFQRLIKIELPLALPVMIAGFRNMVVMTIALAGIASFIGAGGLGVGVFRGITTNNMAMTLAASILIACIALILDLCIAALEKRAMRHL